MAKTEPNTAAELLLKKEVAALLRCSERQVELLAKDGRIPRPLYVSKQAPRWRRRELLAALELESTAAGG